MKRTETSGKKNSHKKKNRFKISTRFWILLIPCLLLFVYGVHRMIAPPLVSVVLPVYNGAKNNYLNRSVSSILNQTFKDFELILIDDGSTDNSWEIMQNYASRDSRIRLLKNDRNRGISYTRNRGNDAARGKYILIMDQDDDNLISRMEKQVALFKQRPDVDVVVTSSLTPAPWQPFDSEDRLRLILFFSNDIGHPNIMVKKQFLDDHHIRYDEEIKCANDYDWLLQIRDNDGHFAYTDEALFLYNGAGFSSTSLCPSESRKIHARFSSFDLATQTEDYICDVIKMALNTPKYKRLFTPGYLENLESSCPTPQ